MKPGDEIVSIMKQQEICEVNLIRRSVLFFSVSKIDLGSSKLSLGEAFSLMAMTIFGRDIINLLVQKLKLASFTFNQ